MGDERVVIPSTAEIGNIFQYCAIFCNRNIILEGVGSYGKREVLSPCPPPLLVLSFQQKFSSHT